MLRNYGSPRGVADDFKPRARHCVCCRMLLCNSVCVAFFGFVYQKTARDGLSSLLLKRLSYGAFGVQYSDGYVRCAPRLPAPHSFSWLSTADDALGLVYFQVNDGLWYFLYYTTVYYTILCSRLEWWWFSLSPHPLTFLETL